jgi:hypothetical protein
METLEPVPGLIDEDPLARFLLFERHYAATKNRVKPAAFEPPPDGIAATSVFAIRGLPEATVWELGQVFVATLRGRTLKARADVQVRHVREVSLQVVLDNVPARHVNIVGWPAEKSARKSCLQELAARATLKLAPGNNVGEPTGPVS